MTPATTAAIGPQSERGDPDQKNSLPLPARLAYATGGIADRIGNQGLKDLANPIYNLVIGLNPAVIGVIFVVTRFFDAFVDPFIGHWSDNTRSRWGRRKPFLLYGGVLGAAAIVPMLWMPATLTGNAQLAWMLAAAVLFYAAFSIFNVPYRALAYELAPGYHEKTRLLGLRTIFTTLGAFTTAWVYPLLTSGWFGTARESLLPVAGGVALLLLASMLTPALLVREPGGRSVVAQPRVPLRESFAVTLRCRPFLTLAGVGMCTIVGVNVGFGFASYVTIYHVFGGNTSAAGPMIGWMGTAWVIASLAVVPLTTALSRRLGKRNTLRAGLASGCLGALASWWLFNPTLPWLQLLLPILLAPATVGLWLFGESMVADVCAAEALRSGVRREAMFSAVFGWLLRTSAALAVLASNLLLNATGFDVKLGPAQAAETLTNIRLLYAALPLVGFVGSLLLLTRYRSDGATDETSR
jgi:GPH family glycoside/pentoside/hexuronide:cation symporter